MKKIYYKYQPVGKVFADDRYNVKKALDHTLKFLRDKAVSQQELQARRSKNIAGIQYLGLTPVGDLRFASLSEDRKQTYIQSIRFYDMHKRRPRTRNQVLDMMRNSDVGVYCSDPSFLHWGGAYNAHKGGFGIVVENRPPKGGPHKKPEILAKQNRFVLCKHLISVLRAAPWYHNNIVRDLAKYYRVEDEEMIDEIVAKEELERKDKVGKVKMQSTKTEESE